MLRLESARVALYDEVESEVKASIAEEERLEERVEKDTLIIDNEAERVIRKGLDLSEEHIVPERSQMGKEKVRGKVKLRVLFPDQTSGTG